MGRPRPRPVAEATPLADELEATAPLLEALKGLENVRRILVAARRMRAELPKLQAEFATLSADVPRLRTKKSELQAAIDRAMNTVMELQQRGVLVQLPTSITGAR